MKTIDLFKKYLPSIIYTFVGLMAIFVIYKIVIRLKSSGLAVGGIIADNAEDQTISNQSGLSIHEVQRVRKSARDLAFELHTLKDMSLLDKLKNAHFQSDSETLDNFNVVKSADHMSVFKNFYEQIFTAQNSLLEDLKETLSAKKLNKVPFIEML